jgi:hypothetical protein
MEAHSDRFTGLMPVSNTHAQARIARAADSSSRALPTDFDCPRVCAKHRPRTAHFAAQKYQ